MTDETKTPTAEATSARASNGQFKPGVSGNPNGRPTIVKQVRELLQDEVPTNIEVLKAIRDNKDAKDADRIACIKELNDRALGRAPQAVEHSGSIGNGNGPGDLTPDIAQQPNLSGLRERVIADAEAQRQAAALTPAADGQTIQ